MKIRHSLLIASLVLTATASAQVGYINKTFAPGDNWFTSQLLNGNNTLNQLFFWGTNGAFAPEGAVVRKWDSASQQYTAPSTYSLAGGWSINYQLLPGEGALLQTPTSFLQTFVGSLVANPDNWTPPLIANDGLMLRGCEIPFGSVTFYQVVGRAPREGETVTRLNLLNQQSWTTTFDSGAWDNGTPTLDIMEAAKFNLGPVPVPEPSSLGLLALGLALVCGSRRR